MEQNAVNKKHFECPFRTLECHCPMVLLVQPTPLSFPFHLSPSLSTRLKAMANYSPACSLQITHRILKAEDLSQSMLDCCTTNW